MYKVLIVEDEPLELQALAKMVGAYGRQVEAVYLASDGHEALRLARVQSPHLILMDINIPGCSGLEVIKTLRGEGYRGAVIIVTAYGQFEYAQIALRVEAADYLLKPLDAAELDHCLQKVFARLDTAAQAQDVSRLQARIRDITACLQPIMLAALFNGQAPEETMRTLFGWPEDGNLQAFALRLDFDHPLNPDEQKCLYFDLYSLMCFQFTLIASTEDSRMLLAMQSLNPMEPAQLELALWCAAVSALKLIQAKGHSCRLTGSPLYVRYGDFAAFAPEDSARSRADMPHLPLKTLLDLPAAIPRDMPVRRSKALMRLKAGMPQKTVPLYKPLLSQQSTQWAGLYFLFEALTAFDPQTDVLGAYQAVAQGKASAASCAAQWLEQNARRSCPARGAATSFLIGQALEIIDSQYMDAMLSQADIARQLGLSQAYFSRLFKKEVGETFICRLTRTRLKRAKALLLQGLAIDQIAQACGYQSKKYFMDAFRQNTGLSVSQYLRQGENRDAQA